MKIEEQYLQLLKDILSNGSQKNDRTGTGTLSVFGRQIFHNMKNGFPLLTTKKMAWKSIVTELLWFLRGDTNIKFLLDYDCHIWDGDAYKGYERECSIHNVNPMEKDKFISAIKNGDNKEPHFIPNLTEYRLGELGPIYGKQWRRWKEGEYTTPLGLDGPSIWKDGIDQIQDLINELKANPDSRRLMVNAWNVGEINKMTLPPCHYGFQFYTRELESGQRGISLMWNQRSVDTCLGLPFNIASYGLLLHIIAKMVNMVPEQLIGNLGDTHIYNNHIDGASVQIKRNPHPLPSLSFSDNLNFSGTIDDFLKSASPDKFKIENYNFHDAIKFDLSN